MLNITELENKHKQYQSKILIHKLKIIVPVGLLSIFLIYFLASDSTPKSKKIAPPEIPQAIKKQMIVEEQEDTITEVASQEVLDEEEITEIVDEEEITEIVDEDEDVDKKVFAKIASQEILDEEVNKEVVTQTTSQETVAQTTLQEVPKNDINKNIIAQTTLQQAKNPDINKKIVTKKTTPKIVLKPSFSFLDTIEVEEKKNTASKTEAKKIIKKTPSKPRKALDRKKYKKSSLKSLLKKFKTNKDNSTISLFIAKKYYDISDYKKAYEYALVTNDIDNNINEAWIILAKSLVKLNQKSTAMYLLITYIRKSYSPQAKILLEDIKSGRFHE
jgi:hypothetical protein